MRWVWSFLSARWAFIPLFSSDTAEPPRKKRRSKWGIKPDDVEDAAPSSTPQGPKGAEAAAAKINAMLAAQGKLAQAEPPLIAVS